VLERFLGVAGKRWWPYFVIASAAKQSSFVTLSWIASSLPPSLFELRRTSTLLAMTAIVSAKAF